MINFISCSNLYKDAVNLEDLIKTLQFEDCMLGQYVKDFNFIPQGLEDMFSSILQTPIEIQPTTGSFLRPNNLVHHDTFYEHTLWTCIVALEETTLKIHKHESGSKGFFDIPSENKEQFFLDNCGKQEEWNTVTTINMNKNDFVFVRPWLWKSLEENKLVQTFGLNIRINQET